MFSERGSPVRTFKLHFMNVGSREDIKALNSPGDVSCRQNQEMSTHSLVMSPLSTRAAHMSIKLRNSDISDRHVADIDITSHTCRQNLIL
jgi:hypothetical protein